LIRPAAPEELAEIGLHWCLAERFVVGWKGTYPIALLRQALRVDRRATEEHHPTQDGAAIWESRVMRFRSADDAAMPVDQLLAKEAQEHDRQYSTSKPFGVLQLRFAPDDVWRINDQAFKKGAYRRGYRKRRLFQLMELDQIAGKKVLDIGCGIGHHTVFHALYGAEAYGCDISSVGVATGARMAQANNVADLCHFAVASASDLPYKDKHFDVVVINAVLHHIIKYPNVRAEVWRVLKPRGRLFIAEGLRENPVYIALRWCYHKLGGRKLDAGDVDLQISDLKSFSEGYEDLHIERFTLFEGLKEGFARPYNNPLPIRAVIFLLFIADRIALSLLPVLKKYTSEIIMVMNKPEQKPLA
jgi:ubiquinone/menaquinone biosynthesis C-methylase UbiE